MSRGRTGHRLLPPPHRLRTIMPESLLWAETAHGCSSRKTRVIDFFIAPKCFHQYFLLFNVKGLAPGFSSCRAQPDADFAPHDLLPHTLNLPTRPNLLIAKPYICVCELRCFVKFTTRFFFLSAACESQTDREMCARIVRPKFDR